MLYISEDDKVRETSGKETKETEKEKTEDEEETFWKNRAEELEESLELIRLGNI